MAPLIPALTLLLLTRLPSRNIYLAPNSDQFGKQEELGFLRSKSRLLFMFTLLWRTGNRGRRAGSKNMASMKHWEVISCLRADCLFTDIQLTITNWYSTQWTEI